MAFSRSSFASVDSDRALSDQIVPLRRAHLDQLGARDFDVLIVGGGINGAVSAAALSGCGARVALIERGDFAGVTSQNSSNLAWGGIKYMEHYELSLVRNLCSARNQLIRSFPSAVREVRFLTTITRGSRYRPRTLWLGTWAYWLIGGGFTQTPRLLSRRQVEAQEPVVCTDDFSGAIEYSDAFFYDNDARFVFNFVRSALDRGAVACNYVESTGARRDGDGWRTRARDVISGREIEIRSRVLINAAGGFADAHNTLIGQRAKHHHVFSKGIHLLVDRITPNHRVLAFFAADGRLFFALPMGCRTCLGTTDTRVGGPHAEITADDRRFVLDNINRRLNLKRPLTIRDIIAERCGVRPLVTDINHGETTDFLQMSRRHVIDADPGARHLTIFGGKLTDCINVGEHICALVRTMGVRMPPPGARWYGEPPEVVRREFMRRAQRVGLDRRTASQQPCMEALSTRLWRRYGATAFDLLDRIHADPREGEILIEGTEYRRGEIRLAAAREMIVKLDDFLRRRSKIASVMRRDAIGSARGLMEACEILFGDQARARFEEYFSCDD